jgi:endoglucanase
MKQLLKNLTEAFGPSGFEDQVRELIHAEIEPFVDSLHTDALGNLIAFKKGSGGGRKVAIAAHMDEIGLMVTHITEKGFLRFTSLGYLFPPHLVNSRVRFADGTIGIIYAEETAGSDIPAIDKHYIDVGATSREECPVTVGTPAIFWQPFVAQGDTLIAKSMDDRAGCAVAIATLQTAPPSPHDIWWLFTVQEEVGLRGAITAGNQVLPDVVLALDVVPTGDVPESRWKLDVALGKGPSITVKDAGLIAHPGLVRALYACAERLDIPYQPQVLIGGGTDAMMLQRAGAGAIAGGISVPCRYVHSSSEMVSERDLAQAVALLTGFLQEPLTF